MTPKPATAPLTSNQSPDAEPDGQYLVEFPSELKRCSVCKQSLRKRHPYWGTRNFNGSRCRDCYNRQRRERYQHDPEYRLARKQDTARAYDHHKRREYMRRWRSRQRHPEPRQNPGRDDDPT